MTAATTATRTPSTLRNRHRARPASAPWTSGLALAAWGLVLSVGLLSFFVHLVHEQVERGQQLHQTQRGGATAPMAASPLLAGASLR